MTLARRLPWFLALTGLLVAAPLWAQSDTLVVQLSAGGSALTTITEGQSFQVEVCASATASCSNPDTSNQSALTLTSTDPGAVLPAGVSLTSGVYTGVATLISIGSQTLTASDGADTAGTSSAVLVTPVTGAVKAASPISFQVTVNFATSATPAAVAAVTQGAVNLDFTDADAVSSPAPAGSCDAAVAAGAAVTSCTVDVNFTAQAPGARPGAIVVYDASSNPIGATYVSGVGQGSLLAFTTAAPTTVGFSGISGFTAMAVDPAGDVFAAVYSGVLLELPGGGSQVALAGLPGPPLGLALDGAGNLFVAMGGNPGAGVAGNAYRLARLQNGTYGAPVAIGGSYPWQEPTGIYVDAGGNAFVTDNGAGVVAEIPAGGSAPYTVIADSNGVLPITGDAAGNLYYADVNTVVEVYEIPAGSWSASAVAPAAIAIADSTLGLDRPGSLAVDPHGDLLIADDNQNAVLFSPQGQTLATAGGVQLPVWQGSNLGSIAQIALDSAGNLYVAESTMVIKFDQADVPGLTLSTGVDTSTSASLTMWSMGTAAAQNVAATLGGSPEFALDGGSTCGSTLAAAGSCAWTVDFTPTAAGPASGTLAVASDEFDTTAIQPGALTGSAIAAQLLGIGAAPAAVSPGGTVTLTVTAEYSSGSVATGYSGTVAITSSDTAATLPASAALVNGVGTFPITLQTVGNQYVTATDTSNSSLTGTAEVAVSAPAFAGTAGGASGGSQGIPFNFATATTVASVAVLTQGAAGQDFTDADASASPFPAGTCDAAAQAGTAVTRCTVDVSFTAKATGARHGAVVLYGASGNALQTYYLSGAGSGSQLAFTAAAPTTVGFTGLTGGTGVAVDAAGDVFEADSSGAVYELPKGGAQVTLTTFAASPFGLALDGAGNLFVAVDENFSTGAPGNAYRLPRLQNGTYGAPVAIGGSYAWQDPTGIYVDANGDAFVTDDLAYVVAEIPAGGGAPYTVIADSNAPNPITGDAAGNLYYADENNSTVYEIPAGSWSASAPATSATDVADSTLELQYPSALTLDPHEDLLIGDAGLNQILFSPQGQTVATPGASLPAWQGADLNDPTQIALDAAGNLYVAGWDSSNQAIIKYDQADVPGLALAAEVGTSTSASTAMWSIGTAAARNVAAAVSGSPEFALDGGSTCTSSLAAASSCTWTVDFTPTAVGLASGTLTVASDEFDAGAIQPGALTGNGVVAQMLVIGAAPAVVSPGGTVTLTVTAEDGFGNVISADSDTVAIATSDTAATPPASAALVQGVGTFQIMLQTVGIQTVTATDTNNSSLTGTATVIVAAAGSNGTVAGGSGAGGIPVTLAFSGLSGPDTISSVAVLTQGVSGLDFTLDASPGTCGTTVTSVSSSSTCTVNYDFNPKAPGLRSGAVVAYDTGGNAIATAYISGTGTGSRLAFTGAAPTTLSFTGLADALAVAVDAAGDVFEADNGAYSGAAGTIYELTPNGVMTTISSAFALPAGIAVDGAGNLYVADVQSGVVYLLSRLQNGAYNPEPIQIGASWSFTSPAGIYVDGGGNVFVADEGFYGIIPGESDYVVNPGDVVEIPANGGSPYEVIGNDSDSSDVSNPAAITGDAAGNLYVGDPSFIIGRPEVYEVLAGSWSSSGAATASGLVDLADRNGTDIDFPAGVAVNPHGDTLVLDNPVPVDGSDSPSPRILVVPAGVSETNGNTPGTLPVLETALSNFADGLVADSAGNLYVANNDYECPGSSCTNTASVRKFDLADVSSLSFGNVYQGATAQAGFRVESTGNADATNVAVNLVGSEFAFDGANTCPASAGRLRRGRSCAVGIQLNAANLGAAVGAVTVASNAFDAGSIQPGALTGAVVTAPTAQQLVVSASPSSVAAGGTATITVTAESSGGLLASADNDTVAITSTDPDATLPPSAALANGVGTFQITLQTPGSQSLTATDTSNSSVTGTAEVAVSAPAFAGTAGGASGGSQGIRFSFSSPTTVASVAVLTQGTAGQDFTDTDASASPFPAGTCDAAAQAGVAVTSCTVDVSFTAKAPGARHGAVVLYGGGGNALQTFYLSGAGSGSQLAFTAATPTTVGFTGLTGGTGVAVDAAGDVFEADYNGAVYELPKGGAQVTLATFTAVPAGLALDGAGNLFVAVNENFSTGAPGNAYRLPRLQNGTYGVPVAIGGSYPWQDPIGIYVDANGDAFVTDDLAYVVAEIPAGGGAPYTVIADSNAPNPITGDAAGNLYYADENNSTVYEIPAGSWSASAPATSATDVADSTLELQYPSALTLDPHEDLLIGDAGLNQILFSPQGQTVATPGASLPAWQGADLNDPTQIALDAAGNLYVAGWDSSNQAIIKYDQADVPGLAFSTGVGTSTSASTAMWSIGTAVAQNVAATVSGSSEFALDGGSTCTSSLAAASSCTWTVDFTPTAPGLASGTFAVASNEFDASTIQPGALVGSVVTGPPAELIFSPALPAAVAAGSNLSVSVQLADANGNPFFNTDTLQLAVVNGSADASYTAAIGVNGSATFTVPGTALALAGTPAVFTATDTTESGLTPAVATLTLTAPPVAVGSSASESNSGTVVQTVTFNFAASTAVHSVAVLTQGAPNLDFTRDPADTGSTACVANTYSSGQSCTVTVDFAPTAPGLRLGAVELLDSNSNVLQTAYISRTATGSLPTYDLSAPALNQIFSNSDTRPGGVALDAAGDVYIATGTVVTETTPQGTTTSLGSSWNEPIGIAVDGAGNVYVADAGSGVNAIIELPAGGATQVTVMTIPGANGAPRALAVDGNGNLYAANGGGSSAQSILAIPSGCLSSACQVTVASGLPNPVITGMAVDPAGDIYYANGANVFEQPASGGSPVSINTGLSYPTGLALDAAGDLYVSDIDDNAIVQVSPTGADTTVVSGLSGAGLDGIALDGAGDLYMTEFFNGAVAEINRSNAAPGINLSFTAAYGSTSATQVITVGDAGNANLVFDGIGFSAGLIASIPPNYCTASTTLGPGANCTIGVAYNAANAVGSTYEGQIALLNATLNATGTDTAAPLTITASSPAAAYGAVPAITPSYSGFVNGDSASNLTTPPTCSTSQTTATAAGVSYTSSCSGAVDANYTITYASGGGTVGQIPITVTASSGAMTYGGTPPAITAGITSGTLVGSDTLASIGITCTTTATSATPAGSVASTCSGSPTNYAVTFIPGTVTVGKAALTVAASNATMTYGGTAPAITGTVTSGALVNGDTLTSIGITCTTAATSASAVGSSPASSCAGAPANYAVTFVNGTVTVGKAALTVTASSPTMTYGGTAPTIAATVTSGALVNGDTLTSIGITCTTTATSATPAGSVASTCSGSPTNYAVTFVPGTVTVGKAALTVTASSPTMTYGGTAPAIAGTVTSGALVNGDTLASIGITCTTTATSAMPAGSSPASSCAGAPANYAVTFVPGTVTVGKAALTVTASSPTMTYGGTTPAITGTVTSGALVNGDTLTSIGITCTTTATSTSAAGSSPATSCSGSPVSYAVTFVNGTVTVGKAALTVTASSPTMTYGGTAPAITGTVTSGALVGSDTLASIGITCTTTAISTSAAGSSPATSCSGSPVSYAVTFVNGAVTVGKAALTVAASNATMTYGGTAPAITGTVTAGSLYNGDTLASIGITCTTTATRTSAAGSSLETSCAGAPANYAVTFVNGTVTVGKAALTVTASNATMTYGGTAPAITGTVTSGALVNGDTLATIGITCATAATSTSAAGSSPASSCAGAPVNYAVTFVNGTVTVNKAALTVTASSPTAITYGQAAPAVTGSVTGGALIGSDTLASIGITCSVSPTGVGAFATSCSGTPANYSVTYISGSLTVNKAPLTVTASNGTMTYGGTAPAITGTVTSGALAGSDTLASIGIVCTTAATSTTPAGSVASTCSGSPANYAVTFVNGTVTVGKAALTIAANNLTMAYGSPLPALTGTVAGALNSDSFTETFTTTAASTSAPGTYAIVPAVAGTNLADYSVTVDDGTLTITQAAQTITFAAIPGHDTTDAPFALSASASSGLPVTFTAVSGPATVSGSTVTLTGAAGTVTIQATQAGNADYTAATPVTQSFAVTVLSTLALSPSALSFGSQVVGTSSAAETVILSAGGTAPVTVAGVSASGDFSASTTCASIAPGATCAVNVVFTPTAAGPRTGTLTINDSVAGSPQTVALSGTGLLAGAGLSPTSLSFGPVTVGSSSLAQGITLSNTGSAPLTVSGISATGDYSASGSCATVPAGGSCSIAITFTPAATGDRPGTLTVSDDAPSGTQTATLDGTGIAAGVTVNPANLGFAPTVVGITSPAQTVTVTDSGTAALAGIAIAAEGDFAETNNCPGTLAAGASCAIQVTFAPTLAGAESGTLAIGDSLGTQPVALAGTGLAPGANLSNGQVTFGGVLVGAVSPAQTVTLTNSGTSALAVTAVAAPAGFSESDNCAGTAVAAGASCSINVSFAPVAVGAASGTVSITDAAGTQTIAVGGQGTAPGLALTPSAVLFGAEAVGGGSQAQTLTVTNTGTAPLTLAPVAVNGDYAVASQCPATAALAPGGTCLVSVGFTPTATGVRTGAVTVSDIAGALTAAAALSGTGIAPGLGAAPAELFFGSQSVGQASSAQTVTVTNSGSAALSVSQAATTGDFSQVNTCSSPLSPGASCVVSVTMTATTVGTRTGTLTIYNNANGAYPVALSGVGMAAGVSLAPAQLAFGSQPIPGANATLTGAAQTVTLTNTGNAALVIAGIATSGDFSETDNCGAALAAGASCTLNVTFAPTALGQRTGEVSIGDNAGGSSSQAVTLTGYGSPNGLVLAPPTLNFGAAAVGVASAPQTATLTNNTGQGITSLAITASGEFSESDNCGGTLAAGASCTLSIGIEPQTTGAVTGTIGINGDLAGISVIGARGLRAALARGAAVPSTSGLAEISLSGGGTPASLGLSPGTLSFPTEPVGTASPAQTVTITNSGGAALTGLSYSSTPDFPVAAASTTCGATLAGSGGSCVIAVEFDPTVAGNRTGSLTVEASGGLVTQVSLSGTATGGTLAASPTTLSFAPAPVGVASAAQTITLTASGAAVALQAPSFSSPAFSLASSTCGANLANGASCALAVVYTPTAVGAQSGDLSLGSNASNGAVVVGLSGSGSNAGLTLSATAVSFATQGVGKASAAQSVTVSNGSGAAVSIRSIAVTGANAGDFVQTNTCGASLANGSSCTVGVVFTPSAAGARTATLNLNDAAGDQTVALSGTGSDFTLTAGAAPPVTAGQTSNIPLSLASVAGDAQTITLSCSVNGVGTACTPSPASVSVSGTVASSATIEVSTEAPQFGAAPPAGGGARWPWEVAAAGVLVLALLLRGDGRERKRRWKLALIGGALACSAACGGVNNAPVAPGTGAATLTVTVTATSSTGVVHTTTVQVNVAARP